jgi:hypothetical protein
MDELRFRAQFGFFSWRRVGEDPGNGHAHVAIRRELRLFLLQCVLVRR